MVKSLTSSLVAGQDATYSLAVSDSGPSDAAGPVTLTDTLPSGESYVSGDRQRLDLRRQRRAR